MHENRWQNRLLLLSVVILFVIVVIAQSMQKKPEQRSEATLDLSRDGFKKAVRSFESNSKTWNNPRIINQETTSLNDALLNATSSPLKVRGGSMTVFNSVGSWEKPSKTEYCVNVNDPRQVGVEDVLDKSNNDALTTKTWSNMIVGWVITVIANDPDDTSGSSQHHGSNPSGNGLKFTSRDSACERGESAKYSIVIELMNPSSSDKVGFYKIGLPNKTPWKDNLRFADTSGGYDPINGPGKLDGEFRERMQSITITPNGGSDMVFTCPDGDCALYMGAPQ